MSEVTFSAIPSRSHHKVCNRVTPDHVMYYKKECPHPPGGDLVSTMPVCVCPKLKDMGPFSASSE